MTDVNEAAPVEPTNNEPVEPVVEPTEPTEPQEPTVEGLQKQIDTLKAQKDHWKNKANAEPEPVEPAPAEPTEKKMELSQLDVLAIARSEVHQEDIERVVTHAKATGQSITEALADDEMKAVLDLRTEKRKAASAANTGKSNPTTTDVSVDTIRDKARSGSGKLTEADIEKLARS